MSHQLLRLESPEAAFSPLQLSLRVRNVQALEHVEASFLAGAAFGATSVVAGQPLDTVKTRMQARPDCGAGGPLRVGLDVVRTQGLAGLYRGGWPVVFGGTMFRSAQFGVYEMALRPLREHMPQYRVAGVLDWQVAVAGAAGGLARGVIEAPFDYVKVRQQVGEPWTIRCLYEGSGVTLARNSGLFAAFSVYRDLLPSLIPGGLSPFWTGAFCSNLAWLTIWPLDVVKSQRQSGNYAGRSAASLLAEAARSGQLFRGVLPGLTRSTIANGCGMMAYKKVEAWSQQELPKWR